MAAHTDAAGVCPASTCMEAYDARTMAALIRWLAEVPPAVHLEVRRVLDDASEQAHARWTSWCEGREPAPPNGDEQGNSCSGCAGGLVADAGTEDAEHPRSAARAGALSVQHLLCRVLDRCTAQGLVTRLTAQNRWSDLRRISDLSEKDASHEWLWAAHPHKGRPLENEEFVTAARLRLGCGSPEEASICGNCGTAAIGCNGEHSLLCAKGESTKGHNRVRDELYSMARPIDSRTESEPGGLIPSHPRLRPADILTGALHNGRLAAVDVGVICPSAAGAGFDCVSTMEQRKRERLEPFRQEMEAEGVEYHPFAVSCWGRLHPSAAQMLVCLSRRLARRDASSSQRAMLDRLRCRITTEVVRRAARMVLSCRPHSGGHADDPLLPPDETSPTIEASLRAGHPGLSRLPPLHPPPQGGAG